jgi:hypothetical protein
MKSNKMENIEVWVGYGEEKHIISEGEDNSFSFKDLVEFS